ncbi:pilin [Patescibacteria group bacterium]|nr:pilin [Patescibacteria group bacterium]
MKKKKVISVGLFLILFSFSFSHIEASSIPVECNTTISGEVVNGNHTVTVYPTIQNSDDPSEWPVTICINVADAANHVKQCLTTGSQIKFFVKTGWLGGGLIGGWKDFNLINSGNNCYSGIIRLDLINGWATYKTIVKTTEGGCDNKQICQDINIKFDETSNSEISDECKKAEDDFSDCGWVSFKNDFLMINKPITIYHKLNALLNDENCPNQWAVKYELFGPSGYIQSGQELNYSGGSISFTPTEIGDHSIRFETYNPVCDYTQPGINNISTCKTRICDINFPVCAPGFEEECDVKNLIIEDEDISEPYEICNQIPETEKNADGTITNNEQYDQCLECFNQDADGDGKGDGIWTAIGCIDTSSTQGIVGKLMTVGIGIAGGIALLMILASAFLFATSEGEPKRTSEAKEILTSAIVGLLFIIFSVTILQFIGVNILKIPEFGAG